MGTSSIREPGAAEPAAGAAVRVTGSLGPLRWVVGALFWAVFATLVFCTIGVQEDLPRAAPTPLPTRSQNWSLDFPRRVDEVTQALAAGPVHLTLAREDPQDSSSPQWTRREYEVTIPGPKTPAEIEALFSRVRDADPSVTVQVSPTDAGATVHLGIDGLLTHSIAVHWLTRHLRLAMIVTGLGDDLLSARAFANLQPSVALAVATDRPFAHEVAALGALLGRDVIIDARADTLRPNAGAAQVMTWITAMTSALPGVRTLLVSDTDGAHLDAARRRHLVGACRELQLEIVDATADAAVCAVAATEHGACTAATRIDAASGGDALRDAILQITAGTGTDDRVVAVAASSETLAALGAVLPQLGGAGIDLVTVAALQPPAQSLSAR